MYGACLVGCSNHCGGGGGADAAAVDDDDDYDYDVYDVTCDDVTESLHHTGIEDNVHSHSVLRKAVLFRTEEMLGIHLILTASKDTPSWM
jgi:hypothetical protein